MEIWNSSGGVPGASYPAWPAGGLHFCKTGKKEDARAKKPSTHVHREDSLGEIFFGMQPICGTVLGK